MIAMKTPALLAAFLLVSAAGAAPQETDATIDIRDFSFAPGSLTVTAGTTVHWRNRDGEPHTVRGVDTGFRSNALDENDSFTYRFDKPGTYRYVCSIHPQMTGTIVVKAAD